MKKLLIASLLITVSGMTLVATSSASENKKIKFSEIRQLIQMKRIAEDAKSNTGVIVDALIKTSLQSAMNSRTTLGQAAQMEKAKNEMVVIFNGYLKTDDLVEKLIPLYDRYFTQSEIHWLVQFYQSSLGQKELTNGVPHIMQADYKVITEAWVKNAATQFALRLQQMKNRLPASSQGRTNL